MANGLRSARGAPTKEPRLRQWIPLCTSSSDYYLPLFTTHYYYLLLTSTIYSYLMKCHYLLLATTTSGPEATTSQSFTVTRASNLAAKLGRYSLQFISPLPAIYIHEGIDTLLIASCYISGTNRENNILIFERHL